MSNTSRTFHLYRFQLLPTFQPEQLELFFPKTQFATVEELISRKNEIFEQVLREVKEFYHPRAELTHQLTTVDGFIVLKIGANRSLIRITKEFKRETLDNWPSVYVVINNDPNVQMMAIELEQEAFYRTSTVVHVLTTNLNERLQKYRLAMEIQPTFARNEFWNLVRTHRNRITRTQFFMIAPNLANISRGLELDLGEIKNRTNSLHTDVSLEAPKGEALTLSEDDSWTQSLVFYSSEGGGTIHLKVKNVRKVIKTEDSIRSLEIDEIYFSGDHVPEQLVDQLDEELTRKLE